ncbi:hypothetical protein ACNKHT_23420 [Shigella flexneri]
MMERWSRLPPACTQLTTGNLVVFTLIWEVTWEVPDCILVAGPPDAPSRTGTKELYLPTPRYAAAGLDIKRCIVRDMVLVEAAVIGMNAATIRITARLINANPLLLPPLQVMKA